MKQSISAAITPDIRRILTFDAMGVSGHVNHTACYMGLKHCIEHELLPSNIRCFELESVSRVRKYSGWFDVFVSLQSARSCILDTREWWQLQCAMRKHKSQLLWYRLLYMAFSRYMVMNTVREIL